MAKSNRKSSKKDLKSMSFEDAGRQNKKQAKREAKLMLKLSEANANVQKAEKKLAKAVLDVQKYEASLEELRQNSRTEQGEEIEVIVTSTAPEDFDEIEAQIVEEILEEVMNATDSNLIDNQENGLQPEEAGDTQSYPTGQGDLSEPSEDQEATDQHETSEEPTSQTEEQQDHTEENSALAEVSSPDSTKEEKTEEEKAAEQHNDEAEAEYKDGDTQPHPAIKPPFHDVTSYND